MSSYTSLADTEYVSVADNVRPVHILDEARPASAKPESIRTQVWSTSRSKRILDIAISLAVLIVFGIPMLLIALCIRITSAGPAIFVQQRVGQNGKLFAIYKFRSMTIERRGRNLGLTHAGDSRITQIGRWLRALKLDELPQFYNILRGDMSVVGPRPKLPAYADTLTLAFRPGITGAASLAFRHEEEILANVPPCRLESFYQLRIKPLKAKIDVEYMSTATLRSDMRILASTLLTSIMPVRFPAPKHRAVEMEFNALRTGTGRA